MKLLYFDDNAYLIKTSFVTLRNRRMKELEVSDPITQSRIRWEINQLNKLLDQYDRNLIMSLRIDQLATSAQQTKAGRFFISYAAQCVRLRSLRAPARAGYGEQEGNGSKRRRTFCKLRPCAIICKKEIKGMR